MRAVSVLPKDSYLQKTDTSYTLVQSVFVTLVIKPVWTQQGTADASPPWTNHPFCVIGKAYKYLPCVSW